MEVATLRAQVSTQVSSFNQYQHHIQIPLAPAPVSAPAPPMSHLAPHPSHSTSNHVPPPHHSPSHSSHHSSLHASPQSLSNTQNASMNITPNKSNFPPQDSFSSHSTSTPLKNNYSQNQPPFATTTNKYNPTNPISPSNSNIKSLSNLNFNSHSSNPPPTSSTSAVNNSTSSLASLLNAKKINPSAPLPSSTSIPIIQQQANQLHQLESNLTSILREKEKLIEEQDRITMNGTSGRTLHQKQRVISITQRLSEIEKEATNLRNQIKNLNY